MEPGITWYEVLGVLPGAAADKIRRRYEERAALLCGEMIAGSPRVRCRSTGWWWTSRRGRRGGFGVVRR